MKLAGWIFGLGAVNGQSACNSVPAPCGKFETCQDTAVGAECTFDKRLCPAPTGGDDSYNTGFTNGKKNFPISWKGTKGVWRYSMRSQDCYVFRHSFPDNAKSITGQDVRVTGYNGFLYYGQKFCGGDFLSKLVDGTIKVDMIDYAANMYELNHRYHRKDGGKTAATVQFRMTVPSAARKARSPKKPHPVLEMTNNAKYKQKTDLGTKKMDMVYVRYCGAEDDFKFKKTPEECLKKVNLGVLKYEWADGDNNEIINWSQCAAWSYTIW